MIHSYLLIDGSFCILVITSQSSIVVTGVPTKNYKLPSEWIQPNTTVVNVASFKNVDEESLLKIPGVVYVSMVGKVTVAMLERNLMRLYEQFHSPQHPLDASSTNMLALQEQSAWSLRLQAYSAAVLTLMLAMQLIKNN
jgi:methylenetetrahydrofolate dehydrogenase (NAD+)